MRMKKKRKYVVIGLSQQLERKSQTNQNKSRLQKSQKKKFRNARVKIMKRCSC